MTSITIIVVCVVLLYITIAYKKPLEKLINRLAGATKISKTKDGYNLEFEEGESTQKNIKEQEQFPGQDKVGMLCTDKEENAAESKDWITPFIAKDYDGAINILEKQLSTSPDENTTIEIKINIAFCTFNKNLTDGISNFKALIQQYPGRSDVYKWFASAYKLCKLYAEAKAVLDEGLSRLDGAERRILLLYKAELLTQITEFGDALTLIDEVLREDSNNTKAHLQKASIHKAANNIELAEESYKAALKTAPYDEDVLRQYAEFEYNNKKTKEALLLYRMLVAECPKSTTYWTLLGNAYLDLQLSNKALECYEKANGLAEEKEAWILGNIGNIYKNQGFYSKGIEYLQKALTIEPDSEYAHNRLSAALELKRKENETANEIVKDIGNKISS